MPDRSRLAEIKELRKAHRVSRMRDNYYEKGTLFGVSITGRLSGLNVCNFEWMDKTASI